MAEWKTEWTGRYPTLCDGEWYLYKNGKEVMEEIPFQGDHAGTYNEYLTWYFDEDWLEEFSAYEDGLDCDEWCEEFQEYLEKIAPKEEWAAIYEAFLANDWRSNSCGGCI